MRFAELRVESDESDDARVNVHLAPGRFRSEFEVEHNFWEQTSRVSWRQEGERNKMVFHSVVRHRSVLSIIYHI